MSYAELGEYAKAAETLEKLLEVGEIQRSITDIISSEPFFIAARTCKRGSNTPPGRSLLFPGQV